MTEQPDTNPEYSDATPVETEPEQKAVPVAQQLLLLAVLLLIIFGTGYIPKLLQSDERPQPNVIRTEDVPTNPNTAAVPETTPAIDPFETVSIQATAAFVWDAKTNRALYQKNPDEQLPLAAITKLMTALVAQELLTQDSSVPITLSALDQDGSNGFIDGERFNLQTLTDFALVSSSNDGAFALASAAGALLTDDDSTSTFVEAMNIRADELELNQTYFRNPTGLDISTSEAGAYGSARDIAFLMEYILEHEQHILEATREQSAQLFNETGEYYLERNTNQTVGEVPGIIGSKTGFTDLAGGNLTIAFDASLNHPIIVVALGSSRYGRFDDVLTLSNAARAAVTE